MFSCTITPKSINIYIPGGKPHTVDKTHVNYGLIREHLKAVPRNAPGKEARFIAELEALLNPKTAIARTTGGRVQVKDDGVFFDGVQIKSVLADRMLAMLGEGFDVQPLVRFMDRLMSNPTVDVRDDLYRWLEGSKLPITEDGCFLAYKYVRNDYKSVHDGHTDNSIGTVVSMPREQCDPYRHNHCSTGLHFCSLEYLGIASSHNRIVVLKIDPADVVAIPTDYNFQKGRACRYAVIDEISKDRLTSIEAAATESIGTYDDADDDIDVADSEKVLSEDCGCGDDSAYEDGAASGLYGGGRELKAACEATAAFVDAKDKAYKSSDLNFTHNGRCYTAEEIKDLLLVHGQRGTSRLKGIPRTTLQEWAKRIEAATKKAARKTVSKAKKAIKKAKKAAKRVAKKK
jgi:hypothetical protein